MQENKNQQDLISIIKLLLNFILVVVFILLLTPIVYYNREGFSKLFTTEEKNEAVTGASIASSSASPAEKITDNFWHAPSTDEISDPKQKELVLYGKELIAHTAKYLGPKGTVAQISNGLNCQNCHLEAGTKVFGNNYGSVASTYPKFRARSGAEEDIFKRINDCFERSLNGKALAKNSKEMQALSAYITFIGSKVEKGKKAEGSGLKELAFLDRAANPENGKSIYAAKCQSCHQPNGEGSLLADGSEYSFPPLWGKNSYNDGAGLYRLSNFARYVKYNMPMGASHESPMLSDEEAWDVAAFVNSQNRPHLNTPKDWPDKSKKPIDHPFGPYTDSFSEKEHKFGPFKPIKEFYAKK